MHLVYYPRHQLTVALLPWRNLWVGVAVLHNKQASQDVVLYSVAIESLYAYDSDSCTTSRGRKP